MSITPLRSSNITLPDILGWPGAVSGEPDGSPGGQTMTEQMMRSMPLCYLEPMKQHGELGLEIFTLQPAWDDFENYLNANEVDVGRNNKQLVAMYQDLSPMSETYTNTYSPSALLSGLTEGLSGTAGELMYLTGKNIEQNIASAAESENKTLSTIAGGAQDLLKSAEGLAAGVIGESSAAQMRHALLSGQKIDFPMMWKGSSFSASYDLSIRLYNPSPASDYYYGNLILGPLAALMALVLPKTAIDLTHPAGMQDLTYQWPFLLRFTIPGLVKLDSCYISSMNVVKGGDVNDRAWNNRPNVVDIRLTISPLYNTMLMTTEIPSKSNQPTLLGELTNLYQRKQEIEPSTIGSPSEFISETEPIINNSPFQGQQTPTSSRFNLSPAEESAANNGRI